MTTVTFLPFRRGAVAASFAVSGWIAFAALAVFSALAPPHDAAPVAPSVAPAVYPTPYAGPASPSFLDEVPEPQPPTF
jgi:hypothetical protein